jgi:chloramphenicol O-acetyltransferase type B
MTTTLERQTPEPSGAAEGYLIRSVRALRRATARLRNPFRISHGDNFVVGPALRVARGRILNAGDRVSIGRNFECMTDAYIGDDVMISGSVAFVGNDHAFDDPDHTIQTQGPLPKSTVRLCGDNLIGFGSVIVGNVTVGRGAIVGAGSLVCTDLPEYMICLGRPARPVKSRFYDSARSSAQASGFGESR